jgi:NADH-quinone oxidoreductase subunit N
MNQTLDSFNSITALNFWQVFPIMVLVLTGCIVMLLDAFRLRSALPWVTGAGILISMVMGLPFVSSALTQGMGGTGNERFAFFGMIRTDGIAGMIHIFLCVSGLFTLFFVNDYLGRLGRKVPDVFSLILFALVGMDLLANSNNLIITFIGLETMSIPLYVMAAAFKTESSSNESGLKYFLLGAFATGFFLYGIALIYGGTGTMRYDGIAHNWQALADSGLLLPGFGLMLIGFLFKVSAFPFHMWTPDVYSGAPTPLAGFMATGSKAAAFIAMGSFLRPVMMPGAMGDIYTSAPGIEKLRYVILGAALLSMIYGNVVAAQQKNMKRMLAYSSIAHSGYILLAICSGDEGFKAMLFYTFIYTLTNIGAFGMVGMAESRGFENNDLDSWKGVGMQKPWFGALMSVFLFSMAGIPPLAGFFGKYFVFLTAIQRGWTEVAIVGIITSVVGAFYYIRVIVSMFFQKGEGKLDVSRAIGPMVGASVLVALVLVLGLGSQPILTYIRELFAIGTQAMAFGK